jgi:hypothetical protein
MGVVLLSPLFFSCSDESTEVTTDNHQVTCNLEKNFINTRNPFNYLGEIHNEMLSLVSDTLRTQLDNIVESGTYSSVIRERFGSFAVDYLCSIARDRYNWRIDNMEDLVIRQISSIRLDTTKEIYQIIKSAVISATESEEQFFSSISESETRLINRYMDNDTSVISTLQSLAVFKHSLLFWLDAFTNTSNPWNNFLSAYYFSGTIHFYAYKGIFTNLFNAVESFVETMVDFVSDNVLGIVSGAICFAATDMELIPASMGLLGPIGGAVVGVGASAIVGLGGFHLF